MMRGWNMQRSFEWEQTRLISYNILAVNRDPKKSFPSIEQYLPLLSDEMQEEGRDDREERLKKVIEKYKKGELYNLPKN